MTVLALKIFLTCLVCSWVTEHIGSKTGNSSALVSALGIAFAVGAALSGFAWVMLFIWLPW